MNILYYCWNENSAEDIISYWEAAGYRYTRLTRAPGSYDADEGFERQVGELLTQNAYDLIFTFDYFPILSKIADHAKLPYAAWVYDCPHLTLYSSLITSERTFLFLFDKELCRTVEALGAKHVFYLPLAVNTARLERLFAQTMALPDEFAVPSHCAKESAALQYPVSFVGSLYETNQFRSIRYLPDHLRGYLDAILNAQLQIGGSELLPQLLTPDVLSELCRYIKVETPPHYSYTQKDILQMMLETEITSRERVQALRLLSGFYETHLFSASDSSLLPDCRAHGPISYFTEMPLVFRRSAVNLNITLRSIHSGIPLRCLDVMGAGGFLLSNPQPELCELFTAGEEFAFYTCPQDLVYKVSYYLEHENERREIAHNAQEKIKRRFSYDVLFGEIIARSF